MAIFARLATFELELWKARRGERPAILYRNRKLLADADYWRLVADLWSESESGSSQSYLKRLVTSKRPTRHENFMSPADREVLASLPDWIPVYRGCRSDRDPHVAMSWTAHRWKAVWFATRFDHRPSEPRVVSALAQKDRVIGYLDSRGEGQIIVRPRDVEIVEIWTPTQTEIDEAHATQKARRET